MYRSPHTCCPCVEEIRFSTLHEAANELDRQVRSCPDMNLQKMMDHHDLLRLWADDVHEVPDIARRSVTVRTPLLGAQLTPHRVVTMTQCVWVEGKEIFVDLVLDAKEADELMAILKDLRNWIVNPEPYPGGSTYRRWQRRRRKRQR